ncbi:hypothetical protein Sjap_026266 [Stephania japonica]|uniref:Uncharacterized protein n=1 Tax=Stephania japonica TaxID=461633 RepID=A0AAP0E374_9MAGN
MDLEFQVDSLIEHLACIAIVNIPDLESKHLAVTNTRPLTMKDDVLVVALSPDAKYIVVALLDCTIKDCDLYQLIKDRGKCSRGLKFGIGAFKYFN